MDDLDLETPAAEAAFLTAAVCRVGTSACGGEFGVFTADDLTTGMGFNCTEELSAKAVCWHRPTAAAGDDEWATCLATAVLDSDGNRPCDEGALVLEPVGSSSVAEAEIGIFFGRFAPLRDDNANFCGGADGDVVMCLQRVTGACGVIPKLPIRCCRVSSK